MLEKMKRVITGSVGSQGPSQKPLKGSKPQKEEQKQEVLRDPLWDYIQSLGVRLAELEARQAVLIGQLTYKDRNKEVKLSSFGRRYADEYGKKQRKTSKNEVSFAPGQPTT